MAYSYIALARAYLINGNNDTAKDFVTKAIQCGKDIANKKDKEIYQNDFNKYKWIGLEGL